MRRENHKPRRLPIIRGAPTVLPRPCTPSPPPPSGVVPVLSIYKAGPTKPPCYNEAVARRRTWSPLTFTKVMGNSTEASLSRARAFRSNDQLDMISNDRSQHGNNMPDQWQENVYEDPDEVMSSSTVMSPPPNIAPISGKLSPVCLIHSNNCVYRTINFTINFLLYMINLQQRSIYWLIF